MVKLIWSPKSLNDLKEIYDYISTNSEENAKKYIESIIKATEDSSEFPFIGRIVPEVSDNKIRETIYNNHRIIYRIKSDSVEIASIFHVARQLKQDNYRHHAD